MARVANKLKKKMVKRAAKADAEIRRLKQILENTAILKRDAEVRVAKLEAVIDDELKPFVRVDRSNDRFYGIEVKFEACELQGLRYNNGMVYEVCMSAIRRLREAVGYKETDPVLKYAMLKLAWESGYSPLNDLLEMNRNGKGKEVKGLGKEVTRKEYPGSFRRTEYPEGNGHQAPRA